MQPDADGSAERPPMPSILDFDAPEDYSEALKSAGYLTERTEGVLTDVDGVLRPAHYRNGRLEFDDPALELTSLYEQQRRLRPDAAERLGASLRRTEHGYRAEKSGRCVSRVTEDDSTGDAHSSQSPGGRRRSGDGAVEQRSVGPSEGT